MPDRRDWNGWVESIRTGEITEDFFCQTCRWIHWEVHLRGIKREIWDWESDTEPLAKSVYALIKERGPTFSPKGEDVRAELAAWIRAIVDGAVKQWPQRPKE